MRYGVAPEALRRSESWIVSLTEILDVPCRRVLGVPDEAGAWTRAADSCGAGLRHGVERICHELTRATVAATAEMADLARDAGIAGRVYESADRLAAR